MLIADDIAWRLGRHTEAHCFRLSMAVNIKSPHNAALKFRQQLALELLLWLLFQCHEYLLH